MTKTVDGSPLSTTTYTNNALNQLTGYVAEVHDLGGTTATTVTFTYEIVVSPPNSLFRVILSMYLLYAAGYCRVRKLNLRRNYASGEENTS